MTAAVGLVAVLMVVGVVLIAIEIFVIPGIGAVGVMGGVALFGAAAVAWFQLGPMQAMVAVALGVGAVGFLLWYFPRSAAGKALVLGEVQKDNAFDAARSQLVGQEGKALTPLRPSGTVALNNQTVDVVTDGIFVEEGTRVRIARVEGARIVVEPVTNYSGG